ncbi:MAG: gliding motility-associated C-terminal domain-containing protein, partial [Marinifilaceae bacterium]
TLVASASGTYDVKVTDANGCTASDEVVITVNPNPVVSLGEDQSFCDGNSTTLDAGNVGSSYLWNDGTTNQTLVASATGTYDVRVTDANGCTASDEVVITVNPNPVVNLGEDQAFCEGNSAILDAGNMGSSYLWNDGSTNQTLDASVSGIYDVSVTDANGCTASDEVVITVNSNPVVSLGEDQAFCEGNSVTLDAGNLGSSYLWSDGSTNQTLVASASGTYDVSVTDANGCSTSDEVVITVNANPVVNLGDDHVFCEGNFATLDAGNVGSSYLWNDGSTNQTLDASVSGTYDVRVTDTNGCTASDEVVITVNSNPVVNLGDDQAFCEGNSATLDAGNVGSSYLWNDGTTNQTLVASATGTYDVSVTDANGCSTSDEVVITVNSNPVVNLGEDRVFCEGNIATLDAGNIGSTYLWSDGSTNQTLDASVSGIYDVKVTDGNGCTASDEVVITVNPNPVVSLGEDQAFCDGNSATLDAGNVGSIYLWNDGTTNQTMVASASGTYDVRVTDGNGCTASDKVVITVNPNPLVNLGDDQVFCEGNIATLDAGNIGSTYLWSDGSANQTLDASASGIYDVKVTDGNGCSTSDEVVITVNPNPLVSLGEDQAFCDGNSSTLDAGNVGSSYLWSDGSTNQILVASTSGTYDVRVTDANGCSTSDEVVITVNPNPVVNLGDDQAFCEGNIATLDAGNKGSTYLWGDGSTNQTLEASASGIYNVRVTDGNGCTASDEIVITVNSNPVVSLGEDQEFCEGNIATLDAGNVGSSYLWSDGTTNQTLVASATGTYDVTVTDANGCSTSDEVVITVNSNPTVNMGGNQEFCEGNIATLDAGNVGSTYQWSDGTTNQTLVASATGTYSVTVTDTNGCVTSEKVAVTFYPNPVVRLGGDQIFCEGNVAILDAGNVGSTYQWSGGTTNQTLVVSTTGTYDVRVTDVHGCVASDEVVISVNPNPVVNLGDDQAFCEGSSATLDAGNVGSTYLWNDGSISQTLVASASGSYSVIVTDSNGCLASDEVAVVVNPNPVVNFGVDREFCDGNSIILDAGNPGSSYLWSDGSSAQLLQANKAGIYSVVVTDENKCVGEGKIELGVLTVPDFELKYSPNIVCEGDSTYMEVDQNSDWSYQWYRNNTLLTGEFENSFLAGESGWYKIHVAASNGCITEDSLRVEVIHLPNLPLEDRAEICVGKSLELDVGEGESYLWNDGVTTRKREISQEGWYIVEVSDENGCTGKDSIELILRSLPIVDLGPDLYICEGEQLILEAPSDFLYSWSNGSNNRAITVAEEGNFVLQVEDDFGCVGKDDINIFVNENPSVYLGADTVIAEGSSILLDAGNGYVSYEWNNDNVSQTLKVDKDGEYAVNVIDVFGCKGGGRVKVAVNPIPNINLGGNANICEEESLILDAGKWERYIWSTGATSRTIQVSQSGIYFVRVFDRFGLSAIDSIQVRVNSNPKVDLGADTLFMYKGERLTLDAGGGFEKYSWSNGEDWRSIDVEEAGDYSVTVENSFGCKALASTHVKMLKPRMVVPNVFTPNGKGPNEIFYPVFEGVVQNLEFYIYTRWGEQVYELKKDLVSNNELKDEGWNGTYKGREAQIGVYVWIIFYGGEERGHGTVTLFR